MPELDGAVALVTGASRRVGRAISVELARAGCDVGVHCRHSLSEAEETAELVAEQERRSTVIQADLSDQSQWEPVIGEVLSRFGRLDVLVCNASAFLADQPDRLEDFDPELWRLMLQTNLIAPAGLCHYAAKPLARGGNGAIINLCDTAVDRPWSRHLAYGCSKAGLVYLTKALAKDLAPDVRVNAVSPGIAVFPEEYSPELRERLVSRVPLKREGSPEEVARCVRFLAARGSYVTGQVLTVDGGRNIA